MTQNDLDNGRMVCLIGIAPTEPPEFVIFRRTGRALRVGVRNAHRGAVLFESASGDDRISAPLFERVLLLARVATMDIG